MGGSGTIDRKRVLIRLRPFMYGDRGHPYGNWRRWAQRECRADRTSQVPLRPIAVLAEYQRVRRFSQSG